MIAALGRADGDAAERAAREHIENSRRTIMDALLNSAGVQRANIVELGVGSAPRNS
jgi:DNA-binding GntR family transcriptional regulator